MTRNATLPFLIASAAADATRREWDMDYTAAQKWSADDEQIAISTDADGNFATSVLDALSSALDDCARRASYGWAI